MVTELLLAFCLLKLGGLLFCIANASFMDCDRLFIRSDGGPMHGEFSSPGFPENYKSNLQCIYTFIAGPRERVQLTFEEFDLFGFMPLCGDYIDIYSEMPSPNEDIMMQPLNGRYCGTIAPQKRISLYTTIVLVFHTKNQTQSGRGKGFRGKYEFIGGGKYIIGTPAPPGFCGFTIYSAQLTKRVKTGHLLSPTYPGKYPANRRCFYRLIGQKGQRIHLDFIDFDLYFGGLHCPYDFIVIHDGDSSKAPIIQKLCGLQQKLEIFSEKEHLYIEFESNNPPFAEHRGFNIQYTFSEDLVDTDKLIGGQSNIDHMRGTECDIRVRSGKETSHTITSPNYPHQYPLNKTCTYFLDGLQGPQHLEKVMLTFESFAVASRLAEAASRLEDLTKCADSFLAVHTSSETGSYPAKGAEPDFKFCSTDLPQAIDSDGPRMILTLQTGPYLAPQFWPLKGFKATVTFVTAGQDPKTEDPDFKHCGRGSPTQIESNVPRLILVFKTANDTRDQGFKAHVKFKTDFGIPGKPLKGSNVCEFEFDSRLSKEGDFNSPRFPSNYPTHTECIYYLNALPGEEVYLNFLQFSLDAGLSEADECGDYMEMTSTYPLGLPSIWLSPSAAKTAPAGRNKSLDILLGRYCKKNTPGPTVSGYGSNSIKVIFHSDAKGVGTGFKAKYRFLPEKEPISAEMSNARCGGILDGKPGGDFSSPGYPNRYEKNQNCNWLIRVRPGYKVLLQVHSLKLEGKVEFSERSKTIDIIDCGLAVIRIYTNDTGIPRAEFCGNRRQPFVEFTSDSNQLRINFLSGPDSEGQEGFVMTWTEVSKTEPCDGFVCQYNNYCIARSLRCNKFPNCGDNDPSDEAECESPIAFVDKTLLTILTIAGGLSFVLFLIVCVFVRKQRSSRKAKKSLNRLGQPMLLDQHPLQENNACSYHFQSFT